VFAELYVRAAALAEVSTVLWLLIRGVEMPRLDGCVAVAA